MHRGLPISFIDEPAFGLEAAGCQGLGWVLWEAFLVYDYQVKLVFEEIGTRGASMPIIDCEVATLGPVCDVFATRWLRHVQDDRDSVFVVVPLDALVGVGRVRCDQAVRFRGKLCWFVVLQGVILRLRCLEVDIENLFGDIGALAPFGLYFRIALLVLITSSILLGRRLVSGRLASLAL